MTLLEKKTTIVTFIKKYVGKKQAILGLSGGIDSTLVAYLAVEALGRDRVHGLILPSSTNAREDTELAILVAKSLGIVHETIDIDPIVNVFRSQTNFIKNDYTIGNLKARTRMNLLYAKANSIDGIVLGTGNKTEEMIGYFTKYGDGGVDILPIGDLYKHEVRKLATEIGIPKQIIDKKPTAGLWEGQYDEDEIGMNYDTLDQILEAIEKNEDLSVLNQEYVQKVKDMIASSEHKRHMPPVCKL
jgi:NAD+ synthase